jgi:hypothetical protein
MPKNQEPYQMFYSPIPSFQAHIELCSRIVMLKERYVPHMLFSKYRIDTFWLYTSNHGRKTFKSSGKLGFVEV